MSEYYGSQLSDFTTGMRVEIHPATDAFMRGDIYGAVVKIGRKYVHVKSDATGRTRPITPDLLRAVRMHADGSVIYSDELDNAVAAADLLSNSALAEAAQNTQQMNDTPPSDVYESMSDDYVRDVLSNPHVFTPDGRSDRIPDTADDAEVDPLFTEGTFFKDPAQPRTDVTATPSNVARWANMHRLSDADRAAREARIRRATMDASVRARTPQVRKNGYRGAMTRWDWANTL
jgi:hypothetical protein